MCVDAKTGGGEGPNLDVQNLLSWPETFCWLPFKRIAVSILTLEIKLIKTSDFQLKAAVLSIMQKSHLRLSVQNLHWLLYESLVIYSCLGAKLVLVSERIHLWAMHNVIIWFITWLYYLQTEEISHAKIFQVYFPYFFTENTPNFKIN